MMHISRAAIFLDRDGVLVEDNGILTEATQLRLLEGVGPSLWRFRNAGFLLVVVTNQSVVARGMLAEAELDAIHAELQRMLKASGGPALDAIYFCPHHPEATVPDYRVTCDCRKPRPGLLLRAAEDLGIDLAASFMLGDRMTDVIAGARAGCRTVLVESPQSQMPPIVTAEPLDGWKPDHSCTGLPEAADWILRTR
ncbi:MAG: HAD family hydrolase [Thermoguttaceae bacterium]|jgi:D-glycero-D-manno-heptose 1,7-bisphosphate phosphatase